MKNYVTGMMLKIFYAEDLAQIVQLNIDILSVEAERDDHF